MAHKITLSGGRLEFPGSRALIHRLWERATLEKAGQDGSMETAGGEIPSDMSAVVAGAAAEMPPGVPYVLRPKS